MPPGRSIGESWELVDRPEANSVIANGPLRGRTLRWLLENHGKEVLGQTYDAHEPFPLLVKILDATDRLSLQVHPSPEAASKLGGEPKSEFWYVAGTEKDTELFVGLRAGITRKEFSAHIRDARIVDSVRCFHVRSGDGIFVPSGTIHAIGAGAIIFEIQQNSDTTYRVYDWDRPGADGKPRQLHIEQSLAAIDFSAPEPILTRLPSPENGEIHIMVDTPLFRIEAIDLPKPQRYGLTVHGTVIAITQGRAELETDGTVVPLCAGEFSLLPACLSRVNMIALETTRVLAIRLGAQAESAPRK